MKSILDPSFRYVPSHATDLKKTFERIRREREVSGRNPNETVVQIGAKKAAGRQ
ncbi:MAG: hypothetical protein JOZ85_14375 [Betaproteobacteria bacterium]|nr:hypothetical protein [Betaproteobacteria bacterium]